MIVTVTMNPALDKTAEVERLLPGGLNRLKNVRTDAGGKGVNVSKMIAALGGVSVCTGFAGGGSGETLCRRLDEAGIRHAFLTVADETRTNLKLLDAERNLTELNEPGVRAGAAEIDALLERIRVLAGGGGIVVLSGSLPDGADIRTYRRFTEALRAAGCTVLVDADGGALREALEAPPNAVKPNRFELLQYCGLPENTPDSALPALCRAVLEKGVDWVVLSMGADGAMFVTARQAARAQALPVQVQSAVAAGDSMVGALAYALEAGLGFEDTVRLAMAASIGAVTTPGTNPPTRELVETLRGQIGLHRL